MSNININNNITDDRINNIIKFNNKFSKYTTNYILLVIFHIPDKHQNYHKFTYVDNIHFLELHMLSKTNGVNFYNNNDTIYLDNIIQLNFKFKIMNVIQEFIV